MTNRLRILVTGFRPFPGAPYNPTEKLVDRLMRIRRPLFEDVERIAHVFEVSYSAVDRDLAMLIAAHRPDALLMFGLAARTSHLRVETRARNIVTQLWPDADHARVDSRSIVPGAISTRPFGSLTAKLLRAAQNTGIDARCSLSAGFYLCNYLSWRAIEATRTTNGPRLAAFIHVPLVRRDPTHSRTTAYTMTFEELVDAGEALLMETVRLARATTKKM